MIVFVRDGNVEQASRLLKKKLQRDGLFRELRLRKHFEKPSLKKARKSAESIRRSRKMQRKRDDRG